MRKFNLFFSNTMIALAAITIFQSSALGQIARISLTERKTELPASDLVNNRQTLSPLESLQLSKEQGIPLSTLNPADSSIWTSETEDRDWTSARERKLVEGEIQFHGHLKSSNIFRFSGIDEKGEVKTFYIDKRLHATLALKELLQKLGYIVPEMQYLPELRLKFESLEQLEEFISQMRSNTLGRSSRWVKSRSDENSELVLQDLAAIELHGNQPYNVAFGVPRGSLKQRTLRALVVPYALLNWHESLNTFSWELGRIDQGHLELKHFWPLNDFSSAHMSDLRWIASRLAILSRQDFQDITKAAKLPAAAQELLFHKLLSRSCSLLKKLQLNCPSDWEVTEDISVLPDLSEGHLLPQDWQARGFGTEFSQGYVGSPLDDYKFFFLSTLQSLGIDNAIAKINQKLHAMKADRVERESFEQEAQEVTDRYINEIMETGRIPEKFVFPIKTWAAPTLSGQIILSRNIVVGNYMGTNNFVQVADVYGTSIKPGVVGGVRNLTDLFPNIRIEGGVAYTKLFVHLKPISSLKDVFKQNYGNIVVSNFTNKFVTLLEKEISRSHHLREDQIDEKKESFEKILSVLNENLGVGESLIILERLDPAVSSQASTGALLNGLLGSLQIGATSQQNYINRIHINRASQDSVQIFDDFGRARKLSFYLNFQKFIPIFRHQRSRHKGIYGVDSFTLDLTTDPNKNPDFLKNISILNQTLKAHSTEDLRAEKKPIHINANFHDKKMSTGFLIWRKQRLNGYSQLSIDVAENIKGNYSQYATSINKGRNWESFFKDILNYTFIKLSHAMDSGFTPQIDPEPWARPGDTYKGLSSTTSISMERSLSSQLPAEYLSVSSRKQGWSKDSENLVKLTEKLNKTYGVTLFNPRDFSNLSSIDLYNIQVNTHIYEGGILRLKSVNVDELIIRAHLRDLRRADRCLGTPLEQHYTLKDGRKVWTCSSFFKTISSLQSCQKKAVSPKDENDSDYMRCWVNVVKNFWKEGAYKHLVRFVGVGNLFVHATVDGFRNDSEVLSETIISNTYGIAHPIYPYGIYSAIQEKTGVGEGELNGYWLREQL